MTSTPTATPSFFPKHDFAGESTVAGLLSQLMLVVVSLQGVLQVWLVLVAPLHALILPTYGPFAALSAIVFGTVLLGHFIGLLLTVPALTGVKIGKIQVQKVATLEQVMKDMPLVALNFVISVVLSSITAFQFTPKDVLQDITFDLPSSQLLVAQSIAFFFIAEIIFYYVHRALHVNKRLYARIHKIHHKWTAPVAMVATYAHPIEHIFANLATVSVGPMLCGAHPAVMLAYALMFQAEAYAHHSGYWSDDMGLHDLHHEKFNVNFGLNGLMDHLHGTYRVKGLLEKVASFSGEALETSVVACKLE